MLNLNLALVGIISLLQTAIRTAACFAKPGKANNCEKERYDIIDVLK